MPYSRFAVGYTPVNTINKKIPAFIPTTFPHNIALFISPFYKIVIKTHTVRMSIFACIAYKNKKKNNL